LVNLTSVVNLTNRGWLSLSVIDALYEQACSVVRDTGTLKEWEDRTGLAKNTIQKIRSGEPSHNANTKLKLIDAVLLDTTGLIYSLLADTMGMREVDHDTLRQFFGELTYVRRAVRTDLTSGKILIRNKYNHVLFEHIPQLDDDLNANDTNKIVHSGFVFLLGNRLVFLGLGDRYTRMMFALNHDGPKDSVLEGIVLSPDAKRQLPMSAVFFMAHHTYKHYSSFERVYRETYNDKLIKMGIGDDLGLLRL
jgi:hypothetical protein